MTFLHGDLLCSPLGTIWKKDSWVVMAKAIWWQKWVIRKYRAQIARTGQYKNKSKEKEIGHYYSVLVRNKQALLIRIQIFYECIVHLYGCQSLDLATLFLMCEICLYNLCPDWFTQLPNKNKVHFHVGQFSSIRRKVLFLCCSPNAIQSGSLPSTGDRTCGQFGRIDYNY